MQRSSFGTRTSTMTPVGRTATGRPFSLPPSGWLAVSAAAVLLLGAVALQTDRRPASGPAVDGASPAVSSAAQAAQARRTEARLREVFARWLDQSGIQNASLSTNSGAWTPGFGTRASGTAVPVASLSKAITALCVARLVDDGRLGYEDTIAGRLPALIGAARPPDPRVAGITVAQLLRQTSGITSDPSQGSWGPIGNNTYAGFNFAEKALAGGLGAAPGSRFNYNNVNYAILGLMVEAVTGSYERHCRDSVLSGSTGVAEIGAGLQGFGAFGGWEISADDYARFIQRGVDGLSPAAQAFMNASEGVGYGLGVGITGHGSSRSLTHFGNWKNSLTSPREGGAFFGKWENGVTVVATYDRQINEAQQHALSEALRSAAFAR